MRSRLIFAVLVAGVLVQGGLIASKLAEEKTPASPYAALRVGDTVSVLNGLWLDGTAARVALTRPDAQPTVVLAYDSHCPYCDSVAPLWAEWLSRPRAVRVVGLAKDPPDSAGAYTRRVGWRADVMAVPAGADTAVEHALLRRTPWIFFFGSDGTLRWEAHGSEISTVDSLLEDHAGMR